MSILIFIYIAIGLICVGISSIVLVGATDKRQFGQKRFLVYLIIVVTVLIFWPLWIGIWIGNRYK